MSEFRFSKEHGSFYYRVNGHIVYMADTLAFLYSKTDHGSCLLKHGPADAINAHYQALRTRYLDAGLQDLLEDFVVVEARDWPVDEIQKFLDISGYIGVYLDRLSADDQGEPPAPRRCPDCGDHPDDCHHAEEWVEQLLAPEVLSPTNPAQPRMQALNDETIVPKGGIAPGSVLIVGRNRR